MDETTPNGGPSLPPQYATGGGGDLGFFTRTTETVPTALTTGPDGAIYIAELTGIPYPEGYARVTRVGDPDAVPGFDGETPSGVAQVYASGFDEIHSIGFDAEENLYVLQYENSSEVYDPTIPPEDLPPSTLVKVSPNGERETISGDELRLGNYVLPDQETGDIYVTVNGTTPTTGQVLRYRMDSETGEYGYEVVADNLNSPRGLSFGPDGNLYVLEQGVGTPADSPDAADAPTAQFIPGLVAQRGGYTGSITRIDTEEGGQERIYTGLPSFQEFNPTTGEDRPIGVGARGFTIGEDGTVWIASGGGLSNETADALGPIGDGLRGVLRLDGLFGDDPSAATYTPLFDSVAFAGANGPDGGTTLFNTQSNLNDITFGADGKLYAVDAARNVLYGLGEDGTAAESVTNLQKRPPVLTPPQYAAVVEAGGDPDADYRVEINEVTRKGANGLPDTPGRQEALANAPEAPAGEAPTAPPPFGGEAPPPPPRGEDTLSVPGNVPDGPPAGAAVAGASGNAEVIGSAAGDGLAEAPPASGPGAAPPPPEEGAITPPPAAVSPDNPGDIPAPGAVPPNNPGNVPPGPPPSGPTSPLIPGPIDPLSPPVQADNPYADFFDPFFGVYNPAPSDRLALPNGEDGHYVVSNVYSFGDRLSEDGGAFGKNAVAESLGVDVPYTTAPYSPEGNFTDGRNWTTYLARILGTPETEGDKNFAYLDATARPIANPLDPFQAETNLTNFDGQIDRFEQTYGRFSRDDLVTVNLGGNDLTLPTDVPPEEAIDLSVQAVVDGLDRLVDLGAEHFLVSNVADVELAPLFSDPAFQEALGAEPGSFGPVVEQFNAELATALEGFEAEAGVDVKLLDLNTLFDAVAAEPGAYGFTNVAEPVLANPPQPGGQPIYNPAIVGQDPAVQHSTLFIDPFFHPTALGHSIVAETARNTLLETGDTPVS